MKRTRFNLCCLVRPAVLCFKCGNGICTEHSTQGFGTSSAPVECRSCCETWAVPAIKRAIKKEGEFSHNIVSSALRAIANSASFDVSNDLIDRFDLAKKFGISKR